MMNDTNELAPPPPLPACAGSEKPKSTVASFEKVVQHSNHLIEKFHNSSLSSHH
jgi:hypothetical protein